MECRRIECKEGDCYSRIYNTFESIDAFLLSRDVDLACLEGVKVNFLRLATREIKAARHR